jgi:hypothetical protein
VATPFGYDGASAKDEEHEHHHGHTHYRRPVRNTRGTNSRGCFVSPVTVIR